MKKVIVISTSLRRGSNSDMLADQFVEGAKAAGNDVEKISLIGKNIQFCKGVNDAREIEGNPKLQEAFDLGKSIS